MAVINFHGALRTYLLADSDISSIIGEDLYCGYAPEDVNDPYSVFNLISSENLEHLNNQTGIVVDRWQIDSYSKDLDTAVSLYEAVYNRLKFVDYTLLSDYKVYFCHRVNFTSIVEPVDKGTEENFYRYIQDFSIKRNFETT